MKLLFLVGITFLLQDCTPADEQKARTIVVSHCPELKKYSNDQMKRAAVELRELATESTLSVMVTDYGKLRDACRVLETKMKAE